LGNALRQPSGPLCQQQQAAEPIDPAKSPSPRRCGAVATPHS
jgi:hypothetical protein